MGGFNGGGLGAVTAARIKNTSIPNLIYCYVCKKTKDKTQFSNKQLESARYKIVQENSSKPHGSRSNEMPAVRCRECVGQVVSEMECHLCGKIKDLNEFAKTHRKNPDLARCIECMESTLAVEPEDHTAVIGRYSDSSDDDDDDEDRSTTTGISNPWQMDWDGDFVTSDQNSSRAQSVAGGAGSTSAASTAGRAPGRIVKASGLSNLTAANVNAFNSRTGTDSASKSNASSQTETQLSNALLDMSVKDDALEEKAQDADDDASEVSVKPSGVNAWKTFSAAVHQPVPKPQGQAFRAYGPGGQTAVHHRAPSSLSNASSANASSANAWQTATRQKTRTQRPKPTASTRAGNFAKVRPDNYKSPEEKAKGKGIGPWADPTPKDEGGDDDDDEGW